MLVTKFLISAAALAAAALADVKVIIDAIGGVSGEALYLNMALSHWNGENNTAVAEAVSFAFEVLLESLKNGSNTIRAAQPVGRDQVYTLGEPIDEFTEIFHVTAEVVALSKPKFEHLALVTGTDPLLLIRTIGDTLQEIRLATSNFTNDFLAKIPPGFTPQFAQKFQVIFDSIDKTIITY